MKYCGIISGLRECITRQSSTRFFLGDKAHAKQQRAFAGGGARARVTWNNRKGRGLSAKKKKLAKKKYICIIEFVGSPQRKIKGEWKNETTRIKRRRNKKNED